MVFGFHNLKTQDGGLLAGFVIKPAHQKQCIQNDIITLVFIDTLEHREMK